MNVYIVPVTPFEQNCSVLVCEETGVAAVVDPGAEIERIEATLAKAGARLGKILVTHGHCDHAGATAALARRHAVPIEGPHVDDRFWIDAIAEQGRMFGLREAEAFVPDRWLAQGDTVTVGALELEVLHCPGHTPGHVVFFHRPSRFAVVGDVLFRGSIGRTDFPRGNLDMLLASIRDRLWPLGDDVTFLPGHGPTSTFGEERRSNPFVGDDA